MDNAIRPDAGDPALNTAAEDRAQNSESAGKKETNLVTFKVTVAGSEKTEEVRFNTPALLETVRQLDEAASVEITTRDAGNGERRVLLAGTKGEAVSALEKSVVPPEHLMHELQKFVRFLIDHSSLQAIGIHAICSDKDGNDAGFGFVTTADTCTTGQAVSLVNCGDANIDEFVTKAKISVPGRGHASGGIVAPTQEQVEQLG